MCGCDGVTYSNECDAHSQGINVSFRGKCPQDRTSDPHLQQAVVSPVEYESSTSSASSIKSTLMLGSVIHNAVASKAVTSSPPRSRILQTCSYNVEVFVSGCAYFG